MKKNLKASILATSILFMSITAQATVSPSDNSLFKLKKILNMDSLVEEVLKPKPDLLQNFSKQLFLESDLTTEQKKKFEQAMTDYLQELSESINTPANQQLIIDSFMNAYKAHYNQEEINAMIEFYGSEVGQNIISKQNEAMQDTISGYAPSIQKQQAEKLKILMPKLEKRLAEIRHMNDQK